MPGWEQQLISSLNKHKIRWLLQTPICKCNESGGHGQRHGKVEMKESCRCECLCSCFFFFWLPHWNASCKLLASCSFYSSSSNFVSNEQTFFRYSRFIGLQGKCFSSRTAVPWCTSLHFYHPAIFLIYIIYGTTSDLVAILLVSGYLRRQTSAHLIYGQVKTQ